VDRLSPSRCAFDLELAVSDTAFERWLDRIADSKALDIGLAIVIGTALAAVLFHGLSQ
jgi:hypothetical protein